jgi:sortase (surface protein transpeptidase)
MMQGQWVGSKNIFRLRLLWLVVATLALLAALVLPGCGQPPPVSHKTGHKTGPLRSSTARLLIPAIGVNAPIEPIGVLPDGTLAIPTQDPWNDVGWYNAGPHPAEQGSAVINGHLDRPGGSPAVFWHLGTLHIGDAVIVVDAQGKTLHFHVTRIMFYAPQAAPVQDIFGNTAGSYLNLMTCAGVWIPSEHQTSLRLVVYTSLD